MTQTALAKNPIERLRTSLASPKHMKAVIDLLPVSYTSRFPKREDAASAFIEKVLSAAQRVPKLLECSIHSLAEALKQAAQLGLELNTPLGYAYLIPYKQQAQLQIGYRGFITLARRSGQISSIAAEVVYEKDTFQMSLGTERKLVHIPLLGNKADRGEPLGAYATVLFKDGTTDFEYMTAAEIEKSRSRSKSRNDGPWVTDTLEMWRKSPIRRLCKRLPMMTEESEIVQAAVIDEYNDRGVGDVFIDPPPAVNTITEAQRGEIAAAAKRSGNDLSAVLESFGFEMLVDITVDMFPEVLAAAGNPPAATTAAVSTAPVTSTVSEAVDVIEGEIVAAADPPGDELTDLRTAVVDLLDEKLPKPIDRKIYLKGRDPEMMNEEQLETLYHELLSM